MGRQRQVERLKAYMSDICLVPSNPAATPNLVSAPKFCMPRIRSVYPIRTAEHVDGIPCRYVHSSVAAAG